MGTKPAKGESKLKEKPKGPKPPAKPVKIDLSHVQIGGCRVVAVT